MLDSTSVTEKIGILGFLGGIIVACVQVVRFLAKFSEEHTRFMEHLTKTEPLLERFIIMEGAIKIADQERAAIVEEIRGLRQDIHEMVRLIVKNGG